MIEQISDLIETFGLKKPKLLQQSILGEQGVGLDSQELIELSCQVEKKFNLKLPHQFLTKKSTVQDLLKQIRNEQSLLSRQKAFSGACETSLVIKAPVSKAYRAIYEMDLWPVKLPHVEKIEVLYNDGVYQKFLMNVRSETGVIEVCSVRRCIKDESILFFQPTPPKFLKAHCGGWKFSPHPKGCYVTTWHNWTPKEGIEMSDEQIQEFLLSHARFALSTWKENLEVENAN